MNLATSVRQIFENVQFKARGQFDFRGRRFDSLQPVLAVLNHSRPQRVPVHSQQFDAGGRRDGRMIEPELDGTNRASDAVEREKWLFGEGELGARVDACEFVTAAQQAGGVAEADIAEFP